MAHAGRRGVAAPRRVELGGRPAGVQPAAVVRCRLRDPDTTGGVPSTGATRYQLHVDGTPRAVAVLEECGVLGARLQPLARPPKRVVGRACCRGAYLRGSLLAAGSVSAPPSPHLEMRAETREAAEFVAEAVAQEDVALRCSNGGIMRSPMRKDSTGSPRRSRSRARATPRSGSTSGRWWGDEGRGEPAHERGSCGISSARVAPPTRSWRRYAGSSTSTVSDELSPRLRETAELRLRHPSLPLARARAQMPTRGFEGRSSPAPAEADRARRNLVRKASSYTFGAS